MYERRYVSKRIRRLAIAIGAGVSATVVSVFSIVAFLGRFVGTFTVSLDNANVALALSEKSTFETSTSFLHVATLPPYGETTFTDLPEDSVLDNEETPILHGATYSPVDDSIERIRYFKYTFYVKNVGDIAASYDFSIRIIENQMTDEAQPRDLTDTLRVMLYSTYLETDETEKAVYGKERKSPKLVDGEIIEQEPISLPEDSRQGLVDFQGGYCIPFTDMRQNIIAKNTIENFVVNAVNRYTLVMWLEGEDADSSQFLEPPTSAQLKIGVEINAYENQ